MVLFDTNRSLLGVVTPCTRVCPKVSGLRR
jgi:hypothetical protein